MIRSDESGRQATILHADLDAFYASVEQRDDPDLRGRPTIVGGGIVLAASYEAKRCGVKTAMNEWRALKLCPHAVVVPPRFEAYTEASRAVFDIFDDTTPLVEGISIDEAFLDVGGLGRVSGTPEAIAAQLRAKVRERVGLAITVGVARTKFLAKVASGVGKPDGLLVVHPDRETEFLYPLPVERLWGVGPVTASKLNERGLMTVSDVAGLSEAGLVAMVGQAAGRQLHALAHHRDPRPVVIGKRRGSVGSQQALGRSRRSPEELETLLLGIVDRVTRRLRSGHRVGRTVVLRLRFADYTRATRSHTLAWSTAATEPLGAVAVTLLRAAMPLIEAQGITLIGMAVANLSNDATVQLTLPFGRRQRDPFVPLAEHETDTLDRALDDLRERFGSAAPTRASLLGRRPGMQMPMLPDVVPTD